MGVNAVFERKAESGAPLPYVLIVPNAGNDINTAGGTALAQPVYLVKVVSIDIQQDRISAQALDVIHDLLKSYNGTDSVTGASITIRSVAPLAGFTEPAEPVDVSPRHEGKYWRVSVSLPD